MPGEIVSYVLLLLLLACTDSIAQTHLFRLNIYRIKNLIFAHKITV